MLEFEAEQPFFEGNDRPSVYSRNVFDLMLVAKRFAAAASASEVAIEHLVQAIVAYPNTNAYRVIAHLRQDDQDAVGGVPEPCRARLRLTSELDDTFSRAIRRTLESGHSVFSSQQLLLTLLEFAPSDKIEGLLKIGVTRDRVRGLLGGE